MSESERGTFYATIGNIPTTSQQGAPEMDLTLIHVGNQTQAFGETSICFDHKATPPTHNVDNRNLTQTMSLLSTTSDLPDPCHYSPHNPHPIQTDN